MKYKQINPKLDTQILQKAGFVFDGYYYQNQQCPVQLRRVEDGYAPSFKDPQGPALSKTITIKDYSQLIGLMVSVLPIHLGKLMQKYAKFKDANQKLNEDLRIYWSFDKDLSFAILAGPQGMNAIPQNEYTFSLVNGSIMEFNVRYQEVKHLEDGTKEDCPETELILESNPQCICWPYLCAILEEELKINDFRIIYVSMVDPETKILVPFFGVGMPRVQINQ